MSALLAIALAFGQPAPAGDAPAEEGHTLSPAEQGAALAGPAAALGAGNLQQAGDQLMAILDDPTKQPIHGAAWAMLAGLYESKGLLVPAVEAWAKAIELDPTGNGPKLQQAADLADKVGDAGGLAPVLGNNLGLAVDGAARNHLAEIAGTYHLRAGSYGPALGALMLGDKSAPGFADVELLRGVVLAQQGRHADAVPALLTAQGLARDEGRPQRFDDAVTLNVARAHYGNGDWGQAIVWYAKVPRASEFWLDAQFERAWAHFRAKDMNGSLGLLWNHDAPFFADFYWPEVDLLRAYSLFMICKFPDASREIDEFAAKYTDTHSELKRLSGELDPASAYADVVAYREGRPHDVPAYLLRPFAQEERLEEAATVLARIDDELGRVDAVPGRAGATAKQFLETRRTARIDEEGHRVMERVDSAVAELDTMLADIEITRLDLLSMEQQMYERAAVEGSIEQGSGRKGRDKRRDKKATREWPWQGEYWADELGWYQLNTAPNCPESLQTGE